MAIVWQVNRTRPRFSILKRHEESFGGVALRVSYLSLQLLDLILTIFAVSIGLSELNPLMRNLLASLPQLLVAKLAIPLLIAWLVPSKLLIPAILLLTVVVGWDVKELIVFFF